MDPFETQPTDLNNEDDIALADRMKAGREQILIELHKKIIGQQEVINETLLTLLVGGNSLIIGVPGLAKTLLIQTMAQVLDLKFARIQFTPDLMPSDITGTEVIEEDPDTGRKLFRFVRGPLFANIVLADEVNRTPPKTQAALLQAMQEHAVTAGGETMRLGEPFFVLATQNPIEQEGTYPLPEAQLDRFIFELWIDYPAPSEEEEIVRTTTAIQQAQVDQVIDAERIVELQQLVRRVPVADQVINYAVRLVRSSRPDDDIAPDYVREMVNWGAGPRASQYLILAGKAGAILDGRHSVSIDDVRAAALSVLRHRIVPNFHAEAENVNAPELVRRLLVDVPEDEQT